MSEIELLELSDDTGVIGDIFTPAYDDLLYGVNMGNPVRFTPEKVFEALGFVRDETGLMLTSRLAIGASSFGSEEILRVNGNLRTDQVTVPGAVTANVNVAAGNLNGTYVYWITFVTEYGETEIGTISATVSPVSEQVDLTNIPVSGNAKVTARKVYRSTAGSTTVRKLVTTINDNVTTTFTDNVADGSLGANAPLANSTGGTWYLGTTPVMAIGTATVVTSFGRDAGLANTGLNLSAFGVDAGRSNTGSNLSAFGLSAGKSNTGINVSALGSQACESNTGGSVSTFGIRAGLSNSGDNCTGIGLDAIRSNSGDNVSAVGYLSCRDNTGDNVNALGSQSGWMNTAHNCLFLGRQAGQSNATANRCLIKQANINATALIAGDFASGIVTIGTETAAGTARLQVASDLSLNGLNGDQSTRFYLTEPVDIQDAADTDSTIAIPANSYGVEVSVRVVEDIPDTSTIDIGVSGATTRFGTAVDSTQGAVNVAVDQSTFYTSATVIKITPDLVPSGPSGQVRIVIRGWKATAPTS